MVSGTSSRPEVKSEGFLILFYYIFNCINGTTVAFSSLLNLTVISILTSIYQMFFYLVFSEESPCYEESLNWKIISDNYFAFLKNLLKSPIASISR